MALILVGLKSREMVSLFGQRRFDEISATTCCESLKTKQTHTLDLIQLLRRFTINMGVFRTSNVKPS